MKTILNNSEDFRLAKFSSQQPWIFIQRAKLFALITECLCSNFNTGTIARFMVLHCKAEAFSLRHHADFLRSDKSDGLHRR